MRKTTRDREGTRQSYCSKKNFTLFISYFLKKTNALCYIEVTFQSNFAHLRSPGGSLPGMAQDQGRPAEEAEGQKNAKKSYRM
jgi:hypothetical protein